MANPRISGIVNKSARNGKAFTLDGHFDDNGEEIWYSAFSADQIGERLEKGAEVEFEMKINNKGGRTHHNIQKNVTVHNPGSGSSGTTATQQATRAPRQAPKPGALPIDNQRSIVRQNSVNVAAQVMQSMVFSDAMDAVDMAEICLAIAQRIEEHTSGDADAAAAMAEVMGEAGGSEDADDTSKIPY